MVVYMNSACDFSQLSNLIPLGGLWCLSPFSLLDLRDLVFHALALVAATLSRTGCTH